jgi:phage FluMu gp28-like protein
MLFSLIPGLTKRQANFIKLFAALFNIHDAHGKIKPFYPLPFQQEFLKDSMICNTTYKHRIINKGRGVGLTALIAGEILITAQLMKGVKIPVTSISAKTSNVLLEWCLRLSDSCNTIKITEGEIKIERDTTINSVCKLKNGSVVIPISGGSPESIRSLRAPSLFLDEFAFSPEQKKILGAGERTLSEGGQISIISTPRTSDPLNDEYWRIWCHAEEMGYKRYEFPIFPKGSININKSLLEQELPPIIAPWIDIAQLEKDRSRDVLMFCRENLCEVFDESVAFLSWELVKKCCILKEFRKPLPDNPIYVGIDVGRMQDLTAIEAFQIVDGKYYHVCEKIMRGIDIPTQSHEIKLLNSKYDFSSINIDKTGIGLGLYEYLRKEIGGKVRGTTFTRESKTKMATNLRNKMQDDEVYLLKEDHLMDSIHSVPYDTLNASRTDDGHADQFWAIALALMKPSGRVLNAGKMLDGFI